MVHKITFAFFERTTWGGDPLCLVQGPKKVQSLQFSSDLNKIYMMHKTAYASFDWTTWGYPEPRNLGVSNSAYPRVRPFWIGGFDLLQIWHAGTLDNYLPFFPQSGPPDVAIRT